MATVNDIKPDVLIKNVAEELKKLIKAPDWSIFVKTGVYKQRTPAELDWWYKRAASMLRKIYLRGPIGVNKLKTIYGGKKNRGYKPHEFRKASGKIIRTIMQQLEKAGLIEKAEKGVHKGKAITKKGKSFLDKLAKAQ